MTERLLGQWLIWPRSPTTREGIYTSLLLLPFFCSLLYRLYAKIRRRDGRSVGLQILSDPSKYDDAKYEIVAVHGLGANPEFTWTYKPNTKSDKRNSRSSVHLLKDLLMNDERFSDARILHFAYNSDWLVDACFESARDIGSRLIDSLVEHRKSHPRLPLIFVGHSFGGIVIKEALSNSLEDSHRILEDTCGAIFLGTPHLGSPVAGFGTTIAYLTGFLGSDTGLLLSLRSNGEMLVNLSKAFQACTRKKHQDLDKETKIISICEKNPTYLFNWLYAGKIVPWESATFGANFADVYEVDKDHSGLNKCLGPDDPLYKELTTQLHRIRPTTPPKMNRLQQVVIDRLEPHIVRVAEFYPSLDGHGIGELECLPKTREELLQDIYNWFDECDLTHKHIYWLQGKAGTGKSTIARTVVGRMTRENHIVASFFFKRGEGDRARLRRLFTMLASQLARKLPTFAKSVQDALESDPSLLDQDPRVQFKKLIYEPLQWEKFNTRKAIIIVLDALDECDSEGGISTLVQLLLQPIYPRHETQSSSGKPLVRYFLTSRLDHQTKSNFNKVSEEMGEKKGLEEATSETTEQDIERYLEFQLEKIDSLLDPCPGGQQWSNPADVKKRKELAKLAGPLFEFAAAACRYIANKRIPGGPRNRLRDILESKVRGDLNGVYLPILKRRLEGLEDENLNQAKEQFKNVIGSILGLADSFTIACFVRFIGVPEPEVRDELQHFESVLVVPLDQDNHSCIKLFHESFRDFLIGPKAHKEFKIDTKRIHQCLAARCRQLLCGALHENICGLKTPGARRSEVSEETLGNSLPQEIQYACRFWIYHVKKSESMIQDDDDWHSFLSSHFLHWLEALSFLGRISESTFLIKELQTITHPNSGVKVWAFLEDAETFVVHFRPAIDIAPLQLYSSALTFAPTGSIIRKTFEACRPSWISHTPKVEPQWGPTVQILGGQDSIVQCASFSPKGLLASGGKSGTVNVWDPASGTCLQTLHIGDNSQITALAFSETGRLACLSRESLSIWDMSEGVCLHMKQLKRSSHFVSIVFLNDQKLLISRSKFRGVVIWELGHDFHELKLDELKINQLKTDEPGHDAWECFNVADSGMLVLSFDGRCIAWVSSVEIKLLDVDFDKNNYSLKVLGVGKIGRGLDSSACFSRDSELFAVALKNAEVKIWNTASAEYLHTLKCGDYITKIAFSPDNQTLAVATLFSEEIVIWDWRGCTRLQILVDRGVHFFSLEYSPDGAWLASASDDGTIKIWEASSHISGAFETHPHGIELVAMAMDGQRLITSNPDSEYRLWGTFGSDRIPVPAGDARLSCMAISADGNMLATIGKSLFQIWDLSTGDCLFKSDDGYWIHIRSMAFSASGERLVVNSAGGKVEVWLCPRARLFKELEVRSVGLLWGTFISSNGEQVAWSEKDMIWTENLSTGKSLKFSSEIAGGVALSQNGKRLAAVSLRWSGTIWDTVTGTCLRRFDSGFYYPRPLDPSFINFDFTVVAGSPEVQPLEDCLIKYHISPDGAWLMRRTERLLWMPPEYRPRSAIASGSRIAIGCMMSRPIVIGFSEDGP